MAIEGTKRGPKGAERYPRQGARGASLIVNEVYASIQGEGPETGSPAVIARLTGCNLRCSYCDSTHAFFRGKKTEIGDLVERIASFRLSRVLITGGEPLAQAATPSLCKALIRRGLNVSIETNGSYPVEVLPESVVKVVDVKSPGSGSGGSFRMDNLKALARQDALKFVVSSKKDYAWSHGFILANGLTAKGSPQLFLSPAFGKVTLSDLASWMLKDRLEARLQAQLHKVIWGDRRGV